MYKHSKHTSMINSAVNKVQLDEVMCRRGGGSWREGMKNGAYTYLPMAMN